MNLIARQISQRMSLRKPQNIALEAFVKATNLMPMKKTASKEESLQPLQTSFPHVQEFARDFPNLCFALATGVGKTRLMGAMISYLFLNHGIRDFVVLAPNNTILEKLTREFSDKSNPKYIFKGIEAFTQSPKVITNLNFDDAYGVRNEWSNDPDLLSGDEVHINVFNIAMIHTDKRRMKKPLGEKIVGGMSYFEYLAKLDNLVVFMDEAHRYRANAALKAIDELSPILGIELTATPQIEKGGGQKISFKNVIYNYPLSSALEDKLVKEPAVVGRENFHACPLKGDALEKLKLEDGVRCHENTKIHLQNFAFEREQTPIKPFMLVIAENTSHANHIEDMVKDDDFFNGAYKNKVRVVHSGVEADEEERMVKDLLEIESPDNLIEIVIHVNMLREGWDVTNLYTIVPLRAANSKTLIEQSIGRGLRLPFGKREGIKEIDELKIVSHDRFDEIIKEATKPDSIIRAGYFIGRDLPIEGVKTLVSNPAIVNEMAGYGKVERSIGEITLGVIEQIGDSSKEKIITEVKKRLDEDTASTEIGPIVEKIIERQQELSIRIPRIIIEPEAAKPGKYRPFTLETRGLQPQPIEQAMLVHSLQDDSRRKIASDAIFESNESPTNMIAKDLLDLNDVANTDENFEIIMNLAEQLVEHLRSYLESPEDVINVVMTQRKALVDFVHSQMQAHFDPPEYRFASVVERNFTFFKRTQIMLPANQDPIPFNQEPDALDRIAQIVFCGFKKSQYSLNKFQSNSERIFAVILEQDTSVIKWVRPPRSSLQLFYHRERQYEPDFIVETDSHMFLCEIKSSAEIDDPVVVQKAKAAIHWCELATLHAGQNEGKPWTYLLIPHNAIRLSSSVNGLAKQFIQRTSQEM